MEQPSLPSDPLKSHPTPPHLLNHPKIKPLLHRSYKEKQLNENNNQKSLKVHSKTLRTVKTNINRIRNPSARYIKGYMKNLKGQDSLSKFSYSFNNNACFENAYLFSKIPSLPTLTFLEMKFFSNFHHKIPLKVPFKSLSYLKDLIHFRIELDFYFFTKTDAQTLRILLRSLQCLKKLKSLSLTFQACSNFKEAKINHLPQYLSHLKQLQSLELNFERSRELTDEGMINLTSVLLKLPLLTQIKLDFGCFDMGAGSRRVIQGSTLVQVFHNLKALSEITLNLENCEVISPASSDSLIEGLRQLHPFSLKKLSLQPNKNLRPQSVFELSQTLRKFTSLNILHLNFSCCDSLTNEGVAELGSALSSLTTLSSFSLKIYPTFQTDSVVKCIAFGLTSLHNLVNLKLEFAGLTKSPPDQIQQLSPSLANLTNLKFLEIRFSQKQSAPDDVMETLGGSLRKLIGLKYLRISFNEAWKMTNKGVEALTNAIQKLQGLLDLNLDFTGNEEIDDKAVEGISQALRHLPYLYSLRLIFRECSKLQKQKESFLSLFETLREMKNIQEVILPLNRKEFNEQEVNDLKQRKTLAFFWC